MSDKATGTWPRFHGGPGAALWRLGFALSLGKYALRRRKYPLFSLRASQGGLPASRSMLHEMKLCKSVSFNGRVYFSPSTPRWPSRAFDQMAGRGGLNITAAGTPWKGQVDMAILSLSRRCAYSCRHCYERFNLGDEESVPVGRWAGVIRELQAEGTAIIVFSGGEPLSRFSDLLTLLRGADHDRSEFHLHTSGHGLTAERARELRAAGLEVAAVGLDHAVPARNDDLRGCAGAFLEATRALEALREAGIFTYFNTCLTSDLVRSGGLPGLLRLARDLGAGMVRFLEPRAVGGFLQEGSRILLSDDDRAAVEAFYVEANLNRSFRDFPLISYEAYYEAPERLGCQMAGHSHLSIDGRGNVLPCVFVPVSFGNILEEDFGPIFRRMRVAVPRPVHDTCPSLQLAETIRKRAGRGAPLPLRFDDIRPEWEAMIERAGAWSPTEVKR